jgi:Fibrinogen beta and gamma chains, C-terminal globular domain
MLAAVACGGAVGCEASSSTTIPDGGTLDGALGDSAKTDGPGSTVDGGKDSSTGSDAPSSGDGPSETSTSTEGGVPTAVFASAAIALPPGNCGGAAVTSTLSIQNTGGAPLTVQDNVTGTAFSVTPATLTVAAGATGTLTVSASVPQAATAGAAIPSVLSLVTNDPAHATASINLSVLSTGATLDWAAASPSAANFGVQRESQAAAPIALTLINTGNAAATVTFGAPAPLPDGAQFTLTPASAPVAPNGGTATLSAGLTPDVTTLSSATSTFTVAGAVCGTSISSVAFSGQGGTGNVTGWPTGTVQDPAMTFQAPCGGVAPAAQTFTLKNAGPVDVHIVSATFSPVSAGWSTTASAVGGVTIPATGSLIVSVSAPVVPFPSTPGAIATPTLTLTTDVIGDTSHPVLLEEDAEGAVLAFSTTAGFGSFASEPVGSSVPQNFDVVNSGNQPSTVTLVAGPTPPFTVATATFKLGNSPVTDTASFAPTTFGGATGTLALSGTNLCQPVPTAVNLSGIGQSGGIALSTQSLAFVETCGATASVPQTFTITNSGNESMTWSAAIGSGTWYTFSPAGATLALGDQSTVTVTPVALPSPTDPAPGPYADIITVTTDIVGDTAHPVALSELPLGDVLSLSTTTLPFGLIPISTTSAPLSFTITNSANTGSPSAVVGIAGTDSKDFSQSAVTATIPGSLAGVAGTDAVSVTFDAPADPAAYTSTITLTTTDALCANLPAAVVATGTATQAGPIVTPQTLSFGGDGPLVNCGATGKVRTIRVGNSGLQPYNLTSLTLATGTFYTVTTSGTLPAIIPASTDNAFTITITPKPIPAAVPIVPALSTFSDVLTITTDANTSPNVFTANLNMGAQGAIVSNTLSTATWNFGPIAFGGQGTFNVFLNNTGNEGVQATLTGLTEPSIFGLVPNPTFQKFSPSIMTISGTFLPPAPSGVWNDSATLTVTVGEGGVLCEPLPASWVTPTLLFQGQANGYFASCQALLAENPGTPSGAYTLDPDGSGPDAPFMAYCDMTDDGGGWTLALKIDGTSGQFAYSSSQWSSATPISPTSTDTSTTQAEFESYSTMGFSSLRLVMGAWPGNAIVVPVSGNPANLLSAVNGPGIGTSVGRAAWVSLIPGVVLEANCNVEGLNLQFGGDSVRIGFDANNEDDCGSNDSFIGFGGNACGVSTGSCGGDWISTAGIADEQFGYIFVR